MSSTSVLILDKVKMLLSRKEYILWEKGKLLISSKAEPIKMNNIMNQYAKL